MTKIRKKILAAAVLLMLICISSVSAFASSVNYSTSEETKHAIIYNQTAANRTLSVNTRPTEGNGGALVKLKKSNGGSVQKVFPYYTSVDPLTMLTEAGAFVEIYIGPQSTGQTVTGTLRYDWV